MKNNSLFFGIVLCCIILLSYGQNCCFRNSVRVQGQGENRIKPNIAILYASLSADGNTASAALNSVDDRLTSITNTLKVNGVSANDISTSSISVYPKYNYTNGTSVVIGYTVYLSLTVTIRGIDTNTQRIGKVVDALASAGVTSVSGLSYDTVDPSAGKSVARKNAWNDAVAKAKQYAQLSGRKLGKVILIDETTLSYYPYYYGTSVQQGALEASISAVPKFGAAP